MPFRRFCRVQKLTLCHNVTLAMLRVRKAWSTRWDSVHGPLLGLWLPVNLYPPTHLLTSYNILEREMSPRDVLFGVYSSLQQTLECVNRPRNPGENREVVTRQHLEIRPCIKQKVNKLDLKG